MSVSVKLGFLFKMKYFFHAISTVCMPGQESTRCDILCKGDPRGAVSILLFTQLTCIKLIRIRQLTRSGHERKNVFSLVV